MKKPLIIAHRCGPVSYPEQTVESAHEALSLGADMVELDLRLTTDGALAVSHDESLSRIFGIDKKVCELTADEFLMLRHKNVPEYRAHLFSDFAMAGIFPLLIHVKDSALIPTLIAELTQHGYLDKAVIGVSSPDDVTLIKSVDNSIRVLAFAERKLIPKMIARGVDCVRLWEGWLEPDLVATVKASNADLWVMSGNTNGLPVGEPSDDGLKHILSLSPDGILINDVRRIK